MKIIDHVFECKSRSERIEIFPFYDCHIGKRNCAEDEIRKQVREILKREKEMHRQVAVLFGGDIIDVIKPQDIRFDFNEIADWLFEGDALDIKEKLNDIAKAQVIRAAQIFHPIKHLILGGIEANHDKVVRKRYNCDTHRDLCKALGIEDCTDEAIFRLRFKRSRGQGGRPHVNVYMRHGYGGGRTPGAEPNKIARMMQDGITNDCDVCLTGHTHTYCEGEPIPVAYIPSAGKIPSKLVQKHRYGLNPGSWLYSHMIGPGGYESQACYPSKALQTVKIVIWPFWHTKVAGVSVDMPKIEVRKYPIL
jgi:hypothetical protein